MSVKSCVKDLKLSSPQQAYSVAGNAIRTFIKKEAFTIKLKDRVLIVPDVQVPDHDKDSWHALLNFAEFYKPTEVIILGDFINLDSLSSYQRLSEHEGTLLSLEIELGNAALDQLDAVTKKAKKVFISGNHEKRYLIYKLNQWCKETRHLRKMTSIEEELNFKKRKYEHIPCGGIYQKGYAIFTHGWYVNQYHANKTLRRFFKNIYYGHTHNWQVFSMLGLDGQPVEAVSCGCLCKSDLTYLKGVPPDWVQMFAYFDFMSDGTYYPHFAKIINGHAFEMGKLF